MPINLEGVELLKADLRANAKNYNQLTFGRVAECGTVQCMAGFCYLREVGQKAYISAITGDLDGVPPLCVRAGAMQLGIDCDHQEIPVIFDTHPAWPEDLAEAYREASTDNARVEVACAALDRLNDDGTIKYLSQI